MAFVFAVIEAFVVADVFALFVFVSVSVFVSV